MAQAAGVDPQEAIRRWHIGEESFQDPLEISFTTPGPKDIKLGLYDEPNGVTLIRFEILRITVEHPPDNRARHGKIFE